MKIRRYIFVRRAGFYPPIKKPLSVKNMNLINDLDSEIAFAVLVDKKHNEKIESKDVLPLIGRVNKALEQISESESESNEQTSNDRNSQFAVY